MSDFFYQYSKVLEAAYMHRAFNVVYETRFGNTDDNRTLDTQEEILRCSDTLFIRGECASIFEPITNDVVDLGVHGFGFVTERSGNNINCALFDIATGTFKSGFWYRRWQPIVLRDGKHFFMPEEKKIIIKGALP